MKETEIRELCHRFFDALETNDYGTIAEIYHPDMKFWVNLTGEEKTAAQNLATLEAGAKLNRRRTYDDRRINTFANGFVAQFSCTVTKLDGSRYAHAAALVVHCSNGKFVRIDEYMDSGKFAKAPAKVA